jgi:hypothetical protein
MGEAKPHQALLPLPSFWTDELSKAWAHSDPLIQRLEPEQLDMFHPQYGKLRAWHADDPEQKIKYVVTPQIEREAIVVEEHRFDHSCYLIVEHPVTRLRRVKQVY